MSITGGHSLVEDFSTEYTQQSQYLIFFNVRSSGMSVSMNRQASLLTEPPVSESITPYDRAHFAIYLSLLYAAGEGHSEEKMALDVLGIDPAGEPDRARHTLRSHLERARWLAKSGYKFLLEDAPSEGISSS